MISWVGGGGKHAEITPTFLTFSVYNRAGDVSGEVAYDTVKRWAQGMWVWVYVSPWFSHKATAH